MKTYREWLLEQIGNSDRDSIWLIELHKLRQEIRRSDFETANHLIEYLDTNTPCSSYIEEIEKIVNASSSSYIDYLYYSK